MGGGGSGINIGIKMSTNKNVLFVIGEIHRAER